MHPETTTIELYKLLFLKRLEYMLVLFYLCSDSQVWLNSLKQYNKIRQYKQATDLWGGNTSHTLFMRILLNILFSRMSDVSIQQDSLSTIQQDSSLQ